MRIKLNAPAICHVASVVPWDALMSAFMPQGTVRSRLAKSMSNPRAAKGEPWKDVPACQPENSTKWNRSSYLDQLLAENRRLKEQSVTSAEAAEANDTPDIER